MNFSPWTINFHRKTQGRRKGEKKWGEREKKNKNKRGERKKKEIK